MINDATNKNKLINSGKPYVAIKNQISFKLVHTILPRNKVWYCKIVFDK